MKDNLRSSNGFRILIILVSFDDDKLLYARLNELSGNYSCCVVLNGESPIKNDVDALYPNVWVIDPMQNIGFSAAVNRVLSQIILDDYDILLLLNPDCEISASTLEEIEIQIHNEWELKIATWAPQLQYPGGKFQRTFWPYPSKFESLFFLFGLQRYLPRPKSGFLVGACLLVRARLISEVGYFDERFFLYAEESDWQKRAQQIGFGSSLLSSIQVNHLSGGSSKDSKTRISLFLKSRFLYYVKWHGNFWAKFDFASLFLGHLLRFLLRSGSLRKVHFFSMLEISRILKKSKFINRV